MNWENLVSGKDFRKKWGSLYLGLVCNSEHSSDVVTTKKDEIPAKIERFRKLMIENDK